MKYWSWLSALVLLIQAPQDQWQLSVAKDPDTGKAAEMFVLNGSFLVTPANLSNTDRPSIIVLCSDGHLVRQYGVVRSILWNGGAKIETVTDGGRKKSFSAEVMASRDPLVTQDADRRTFSTFDLRNLLSEMLRGKVVRMSVQDDFGPNYRGNPLPQVLMEFRIPDPAAIVAKCGIKL